MKDEILQPSQNQISISPVISSTQSSLTPSSSSTVAPLTLPESHQPKSLTKENNEEEPLKHFLPRTLMSLQQRALQKIRNN
eukprot:TRINITY_DN9421_c0_g1_i1.p1 TRINITY_DN9421_c0_g1~~TRINITY_DN9421_c0_g1_i1.p1  ORF type:complete len:81 (+),score=12.85 TRINITY_DN9421_c0_g1_i1:537-779(+)